MAQLIVAVHQMREQLDRIETNIDMVRQSVQLHATRISHLEHLAEAAE
jgi:hypothetical protein